MRIRLIYIIFIIMTLSSCVNESEDLVDITNESEISMTNLDSYMFRDDVQYVDLRNFDAKYQSGYIKSFEQIPFFDYLDNRVVFRDNTFNFEPEQIIDEAEIRRLFDSNKVIFMYDDGCIRSGYMKDVLNHLGYEKVFILGGFYEYTGTYKMLGNGSFSLGNEFYQYVNNNESGFHYYMYGTFDMSKKITTIRFDITDENDLSLRSNDGDNALNYHYKLLAFEEEITLKSVTLYELQDRLESESGSIYELFILLDIPTQNGILDLVAYELN
ncbi:MAG: hypothetical protein K9L26_02475 [Candidatus Izimaplasma sp.]|nr:hypothetical protein [Candidatus Izimaplasma bacterium]